MSEELLALSGVGIARGRDEILSGAELRLAEGDRLGLVGPNGSGKSSLLRVAAGLLEPTSGTIKRAPGITVVYLPQADEVVTAATVSGALHGATQRARELEERIQALGRAAVTPAVEAAYSEAQHEFERAGGYAAEASAREVAAALGFGESSLERRVADLSAGERRRLALAVVLAGRPDLLLLDEPTNHLDLTTREWLADRLRRFQGAVMLVSHDRALLDAVTTRTAFIGGYRLWSYGAPYSEARRRRDEAAFVGERRRRELTREAERLETMARELATFGRKAASRKRRAARRSGELRAAAEADTSHGGGTPALVSTGPHPQASAARSHGRAHGTLVSVRGLSVPGVLDRVSFSLRRGDRVVLLGPNGSGKSTLLRAVSEGLASVGAGALTEGDGDEPPEVAQITYAQGLKLRSVGQSDRGLEEAGTLLEQAVAVVGAGRAQALLTQAGVARRAWELRPVEASGGERIRAGLALAFTHAADLWLLDEPTNDLDLEAVEALEQQLRRSLDATGAALLLATHDRRLAEGLADEVWSIVNGRLVRFGSVADYLAGAAGTELDEGSQPGGARIEPVLAAPASSEHGLTVPVAPGPTPGSPAAGGPGWSDAPVLALEDERAAVLTYLADPGERSQRDLERLRARLEVLEEALMERYLERLPPAAPRYRVVERGLTVIGDRARPGVTEGSGVGEERDGFGATPPALTLTLADAPVSTRARDGAEPPGWPAGAPTLDASLRSGVAHLVLREPTGSCLLPEPRAALVDAGARLAFTVLGAEAVQVQLVGALRSRWFEPAEDGWWVATLGTFLAREGWHRGGRGAHSGSSGPPLPRARRRQRRRRAGGRSE